MDEKRGKFFVLEMYREAINVVLAVKRFEAAVVNPTIKFSTWLFVNSGNPNICEKCGDYSGDTYELEDMTICLIFSHSGNLSQTILSHVMFIRTACATVLSSRIIKKLDFMNLTAWSA
jgi:hypothetical protein